MNEFIEKRNQFSSNQYQIIESISSTDEQFDSLRKKLVIIKENILTEFNSFKEDSLQIYGNSYQHITKSIEESFLSSKEIINMIPPAESERLQNEILKINKEYLNTKQSLIKSIYFMNKDILHQQDSIINEFEKKKESWNSNQFLNLIERAKNKLYPLSPIDYGSLYQRFYTDQEKFNNCFQKAVANISLVIPPNQFSNDDIQHWWCEVEDLLECHDNFIKQLSNQFQAELNQNIEDNNKLISDLEKELFELSNSMNNSEEDRKVRSVIDEITPLCKANERVNIQFFDKIQNYFNYRRDCLRKTFESIRDFYQQMIDNYQQYISNLSEREEIENKEKEQLKANSKSEIDRLESEFAESKEKIGLLASEKEIDEETIHCKQLLSQIEQEERNYFTKMSNIYEQQPSKVTQIFEESEKVILEIFKLKKVIEEKKSTSKKQPKSKNQSRQKGSRAKSQVSESFMIDCGLKFESFEELIIIPSFDDFFDSFTSQISTEKSTSKSERTRKSNLGKKSSQSALNSKSPSKSKSSSKSGNQQKQSFLGFEFNESMIPNFDLNDAIPKIDDKIAIWICLPTSDDLGDWFTQFKIVYLNNFYELFEKNLKKAKNEENKKKLTEELNEKLRVLHPRFSSVEVNVSEARKIKIASQKDQLELYFRRISMQFNSLVSKFKIKNDNNEKCILNETEKLRNFVNDLPHQKNCRALTSHIENFRLSDKSCQQKINNFYTNQEKSINDFFSFFKAKNDRFKDACLNKNVTSSEEEKKLALKYFESMDKQMNDIQNKFKTDFQSTKTQIGNLHKEILNVFENSLNFHTIDVKFLEENMNVQIEFTRKYESLANNNFHQEQEIQKALDEIEIIINIDENKIENHQNKINSIFNCLNILRMKILNRSFFLSQLKSDIQNDSTNYQIGLSDDTDIKEILAKTKETQPEKTVAKKGSSKAKSAKSKSTSKSQSKKEDSKSQDKNDGQVVSFQKKLGNLKMEFTSRLTKLSQEYYSQFKTRKFGITRPNEIPQTQNDYLNKINEFWSDLTKSKNSILNDSILKFRYQVSNATTKSKEAVKAIFLIFIDFYNAKNRDELNLIQKDIDKEMIVFNKEKEKNRLFLDLKMADENNNELLEKVIENEEKRTKNEREFINKVKIRFSEYEKKFVKFFLPKMNFLTSLSLTLFDKFVLIEDLVDGPTVENQRKTLKEMKKNKIRYADCNKRPFSMRSWPKMSQTLKFIAQYDTSKEENSDELNNLEFCDEISNEMKMKRRKSRSVMNESSDNLRPDSTKHSGRKQKESKNKKDKKSDENEIKSFDTPVHRNVIIERNRALSDFDEVLDKRAEKINELVNSMERDEDDFINYWGKLVSSLRPNQSLPKLEPSSNI